MEASALTRAGGGAGDGPAIALRAMYSTMLRIRVFEERVADLVEAGEIKTPCHLYIGQEAIAVGVCAALEPRDSVWGGHRSHGHYLAKGGDLRALMAEMYGKVTRMFAGGEADRCTSSRRPSGIFGRCCWSRRTVPLAVGAGLASKLRGDHLVSVPFFGDGAVEEGHVHESLNLAAVYRLPVVFVCENNLYASHMHLLERRAQDNIFKIAEAHGLPGTVLDGNDLTAVHHAAIEAVARARAAAGADRCWSAAPFGGGDTSARPGIWMWASSDGTNCRTGCRKTRSRGRAPPWSASAPRRRSSTGSDVMSRRGRRRGGVRPPVAVSRRQSREMHAHVFVSRPEAP